ncbi:MAG TPA: hypothetical protein PLW35_03515, partial [Verrucomicrobiota bacterium]|nr:hypothetical protein [Verrucomicrobiota bacterium]
PRFNHANPPPEHPPAGGLKLRVCPHIDMREVPHRLRQPRIGTRNNLPATPQSGGSTQTTSLSPYLRAS